MLRRSTALFVVLSGLCGAGSARSAEKLEPKPAVAAAEAFAEGSRLFKARDYVGAIEAFERAYQLRPHYKVQCNIALCHERGHDFVRAAQHYRACLEQGGAKTRLAKQLKNSLERAENRLAWVEVSTHGEGGMVYADGRLVGPAPQRVALNPGPHIVETRRDGAMPATKTINARAGEHMAVKLEPVALRSSSADQQGDGTASGDRASRRRLSPIWFWSTVGLTAALGTAAIVLGVRTLVLRSDYEDNPTQELYDAGTSTRLATNILWGLTAAAGATATGIYFFTDFHGTSAAAQGQGRRAVSFGMGIRGEL